MVLRIMPFKVVAFGDTDTGLVRQNNEDCWGRIPNVHFYVLADGMGGHQAGEVAAREAVNAVCRLFHKALIDQGSKKTTIAFLKQTLSALIEEVNSRVYNMGTEDQYLRGMGTTLCCCYFQDDTLVLGHVGDSRIYRFRSGHLEQLTKDHSLFRELVDMGELAEEDAEEFLYKNIITKAIGLGAQIEPSVQAIDLEPGDVIMMCTDGLTDMLSAQDIAGLLRKHVDVNHSSVEETTRALITAAKQQGGHDNVTVVLMQMQDLADAS